MEPTLRELRDILEQEGLQAALVFLNGRAPHRFTGVFHFDPPGLRNVALADAWNSQSDLLDVAPLEETFCGFVRSTNEPFSTADAPNDLRLSGHVLAKNAVQSYCGVLLEDQDGRPLGTLCHFDTRPCDIGHQALELLRLAASIIREMKLLTPPSTSR